MREILTEDGFLRWLKKARRGERVLYYDGFLMMDRELFFKNGGLADKQPDNMKTAKMAWLSYLDGLVFLVQRKRDICSYEYIAVKA